MNSVASRGPIVPVKSQERLWTPNLTFTYFATFASFGSHMILLSTLPLYAKELGGSPWQVGLAIGAFNLAPLFLRPFIGFWIGRWGKKPFLVIGSLIFILSSLALIFAGNIVQLVLLRVLQGVGIAAFPTGATAMVADLAPAKRRGEAVSYYGMFISLTQMLLPTLGFIVLMTWNFPVLFLMSCGLGIVSLLLVLPITEPIPKVGTPAQPREFRFPGSLVSKKALFPSLVFLTFTLTFASLAAFLPLLTAERGLGNPGIYLSVQGFITIAVRSFVGTVTDKYGRAVAIIPGLAAAAIAMYLLVIATSMPLFVLSAVFYGIGFGSAQTGLLALTIDRVPVHERAAGTATFQWMWDIGGSAGTIVLGFVAASLSLSLVYGLMGVVATAGLAAFLIGTIREGKGLLQVQR